MFQPLSGIAQIAPRLPPALLGAAARARVEAVAATLPEAVYCTTFECRLAEGDARVDLLMCLMADDGRRAFFEGRAARPASLQGLVWERVFDFGAEWSDPGSLLQREVPFIWFEFDCTGDALPDPFVLFCVQPDFLRAPARMVGPDGPRAALLAQRQVLTRSLALLTGAPLAAATDRAIFHCLDRLPPGTLFLHAAPLAHREADLVRLVFNGPRDDIPGYLDRIGWPGPRAQVIHVLDALHRSSSRVGFQIDVDASIRPYLYIQFYYPEGDPRWAPLLDALVASGACASSKRDGVLAWPGAEPWTLPGRRWPDRLRRELELKVVCRPGCPIEAKAYLGFGFDFTLF